MPSPPPPFLLLLLLLLELLLVRQYCCMGRRGRLDLEGGDLMEFVFVFFEIGARRGGGGRG